MHDTSWALEFETDSFSKGSSTQTWHFSTEEKAYDFYYKIVIPKLEGELEAKKQIENRDPRAVQKNCFAEWIRSAYPNTNYTIRVFPIKLDSEEWMDSQYKRSGG